MKYFKLKFIFFFSYLKKFYDKNILSKLYNLSPRNSYLKFNNFFVKRIPQKINKLNIKIFKINYFAFTFSIIFFSYLIYLSLPGILYDNSDQIYMTKILKKKHNLNFSLSSNISYSILPLPHFKINDVVIFNERDNFQKEIAQIKELKIYIKQNNFLRDNSLEIKLTELINANFYIDNSDFAYLSEFFTNKFSEIPLKIKNGNLFFQDDARSTISLINIKKGEIYYNYNLKQKLLKSESEIFNIPFKVLWKADDSTKEMVTNLKFDKIKLNIENTAIYNDLNKNKKLTITLNRSKFTTFYSVQNQVLNLFSKNSTIGNDKLTYSGKIFLNPFSFDINARLEKFNIKNLNTNLIFFQQIISNEFVLNEVFNGRVKLFLKNLSNNNYFDQVTLNTNFISDEIDLSKSIFYNDKILNLIIENGKLYEEKDNLFFKGKLNFDIHNIDKFYNKLVVPKKFRIDLKSINVNILVNLSNLNFKIINIKFNNNDYKSYDDIDNLIYNYNNGLVKITNWIEFKKFTNELITLYSG